MAKQNKTKFKEGNKAAEKWTEKESVEIFEKLYQQARTNDTVLSIDDIILYAKDTLNLPSRTFFYLVNKFAVLQSLKEDINSAIRAKINRKGLTGDFNPTMCIWRQKQLGESDPDKVKNINLLDGLKIEIIEDNGNSKDKGTD